MSAIECVREQELLDALVSSRWPDKCEPEMRAHVEQCAICRDTLTVALPLLGEGEAAYASAHVPSSGAVWWRAQMRARREAESVAGRPIAVAQAVALLCAGSIAAGAAWWVKPALPDWVDRVRAFGDAVGNGASAVARLDSQSPWALLPWIALAVWLVLAPVAIYFAVSDD